MTRLPMLATIHTPLCVDCRIIEVGVVRHAKQLTTCATCGPRRFAQQQEAEVRLRQAAANHAESRANS